MRTGRPTKLNAALIRQAAALARDGAGYAELAGHLGVTERSLYGWQARGEKELRRMETTGDQQPAENERVYVVFFQTLKQSRAQFDAECRQNLRTTEAGWQRFAWFLERRNSREYGRPAQVHIHQDASDADNLERGALASLTAGPDLPEA